MADTIGCSFFCKLCEPNLINLRLEPGGVTWTYDLRTAKYDTYGGQVIQILGVSITDLVITGQFGREWIYGQRQATAQEKKKWPQIDHIDRIGDPAWIQGSSSTPQGGNGLIQLADWFRQYFENVTQGDVNLSKGVYNQNVMLFSLPARGWRFAIRPTAFPQVRMANDEVAANWRVEADFVEDQDGSIFSDKVTKAGVQAALKRLKVGIGYRAKNPFSEDVDQNINVQQFATKLAKSFGDYVQNFSEQELENMAYEGFSTSFSQSLYGGGPLLASTRAAANQQTANGNGTSG